jgi:hypothetical protein
MDEDEVYIRHPAQWFFVPGYAAHYIAGDDIVIRTSTLGFAPCKINQQGA